METIKLDLIPGKKMPSLHASQYDDGRAYHIDLTENRVPYVLDGTETISLTVRKCDNTLVTMDIANTFADKSYIEFITTEQMTACAGFNYGEITLEKNGDKISSLNFYLQVEGAPDEGGITSQSEINNLNRQITDEVDRILPDMVEEQVSEIAPEIIQETIGDNYYNKSQTYSKTEVDDKLDNYEVLSKSKFILVNPTSTINNSRAIWQRDTNKAYIAAASNQITKAYPVRAGEQYIIRTFGYDVENFDCAVIGEGLVGVNTATPLKQVILCGGSRYPADYTNHIIEFTAESDGYLYINERTTTGVSSYARKDEVVSVKNENFLVVNNGNYKHYAYVGDGLYIQREFTRRGPNNLFQLVHIGIGYFVNGSGYVEQKSYMTATTDIIGPFSVDKAGWSGGQWTGGNHSVTVGGVACPTAEQLSLIVEVNGEEATENGTYYGEVRFTAQNKLYFAQTITGNTFTGATPALLETRYYKLTNTMEVAVSIELLDDVRFAKYYGMQFVNDNVVNVVVPDDETVITLANLSSDYSMTHKQPDIILQYANGEELHMILHRSGLGSYAHNNGNDNYGFIATYGKTYHTLISGETISTGAKLYWSGEYKMIV